MENSRFNFRFWYFNEVEEKWKLWYCDLMSVDGTCLPFDNGEGGAYTDWEHEFICEQCTGLKDKNGKLIYENDLIKCPNGIYRIAVDDFGLWTAIYENNPLKDVVEWSDIVKNYAFNQENVKLEVLGNIHENADLLGEE